MKFAPYGVYVYKSDGTLQCDLGTEVTLAAARFELASFIGEDHVGDGEKRQLPLFLPSVCGTPTGRVNAFPLTEEGSWILFHGIVGPMGWQVWIWDDAAGATPGNERLLATRGGDTVFPLSSFLGGAGPAESSGATPVAPNAVLLNLISAITQAGALPTQISDLSGRRCRCYTQGDALTDDYRPQRVNIELDDAQRIRRVWFG